MYGGNIFHIKHDTRWYPREERNMFSLFEIYHIHQDNVSPIIIKGKRQLYSPRLSPNVVPTTTSPWIWPSNGKIVRGPLPKIWILSHYGGLWVHFLWLLLLSYRWGFFFRDDDWFTWMTERVWWWDAPIMLWVNWLMVIIAYIFYLILWHIWWLYSLFLVCFFMVCQVLNNLVSPLGFWKAPSWFTLSRTLPSFRGWFILDTFIWFFCQF